jgi:hypothetical protein
MEEKKREKDGMRGEGRKEREKRREGSGYREREGEREGEREFKREEEKEAEGNTVFSSYLPMFHMGHGLYGGLLVLEIDGKNKIRNFFDNSSFFC